MTHTNLTDQTTEQPDETPTATDRILEQFYTWSQQEPEYCRIEYTNFSGGYDIDVKLGDTWFTIWATTFGELSSSGLAMLLAALLDAIGRRDFFRYRLENSDKQHFAVVMDARHAVMPAWSGDKEPALALLTAYLAALQTEAVKA